MSEFGEKLKERTKLFGLRIIRMSEVIPKSHAGRVLGDQVLRSGTSVGANYREAFRAHSTAEFLSKMGDCLKKIEETDYWLEMIADSSLLSKSKLASLRKEVKELDALFVSIIQSKKRN
jgi:four helix bundle protein